MGALLFIVAYFAFSLFMGFLASSKHRSFWVWFFVSVFVSPPLSLLLFIATK